MLTVAITYIVILFILFEMQDIHFVNIFLSNRIHFP